MGGESVPGIQNVHVVRKRCFLSVSQLPVLDTAENAAEARVGRARLGPWTSLLRSLRLLCPCGFLLRRG